MNALVISMSGTRENYAPVSLIVNKLLTISGSVAILIIANISAYFTTGPLHSIMVYYQIWTLPAAMTLFYNVMPYKESTVRSALGKLVEL